MFMGEYQNSIDDKGRIVIPVKFRDGLGELFYVTKGNDHCLYAYSKPNWQIICEKFQAMDSLLEEVRYLQRAFIGCAVEVESDKQGRINIPSSLRQYASLEKDCVVLGVTNRVEIWSKSSWDHYSKQMHGFFNEYTAKLTNIRL